MTDANSAPNRRVSMSKANAGATPPTASGPGARPRVVTAAAGTLVLAALFAILSAGALYLGSVDSSGHGSGVKKWLYDSAVTSLNKSSVGNALLTGVAGNTADAQAHQKARIAHNALTMIAQQQKNGLIATIVVMVALAFIAFGVWKGRYWSRWGVIAIWFLASFTGTAVGLASLISVAASVPLLYKLPSFIGAVLLVAAVVLANLPTSTAYFALSRPAPRPGQPQRRGMFAPRIPPADRTQNANTAKDVRAPVNATTRPASPEAGRSKRRAASNAQAVAKGADLARTRAKSASKSRRTDT